MSNNAEGVDVTYDEVVKETDGSVTISIGDDTHRIPRFAIMEWDADEKTMVVREDIAIEKGLA